MKIISITDLQAALTSSDIPLLLNVLPEESWIRQRLPGSRNACVYEMVFIEKVGQLAQDLATPLVVYGAGLPTLESAAAAEKLVAAGYSNVADFSGGLTAWTQAGLAVEGTGDAPLKPSPDGVWHIDPEFSIIRWTGRNLFNHHEGTIKLGGGHFEIINETLASGDFTIDMTTIACSDLSDQGMNAILLQHLSSGEFFFTDSFPEANFILTSAAAIPEATPGTPNYEVAGALTLRGVTRNIRFSVTAAVNDEGKLTAQAQFEIDLTQWGVNYGSGKLFAWLGKHVVNDHVALHLKITATRAVYDIRGDMC